MHDTYQGVNALTGETVGGEMGGVLKGTKIKRLAQISNARAGKNEGKKAGEYLIPVFGPKGNVVGYERPLAPEKTQGLQKDTHLGRMLGVWSGRILEEEAAGAFNKELIQTLKETWEQGETEGRDDEFVNVADPKQKDLVIKDAWDTLGWKIKTRVGFSARCLPPALLSQ